VALSWVDSPVFKADFTAVKVTPVILAGLMVMVIVPNLLESPVLIALISTVRSVEKAPGTLKVMDEPVGLIRLAPSPLTMLHVTASLNVPFPATVAVSVVFVAGNTVVAGALMVTDVTPLVGAAAMP
jgi:hypothetical protein